MRRRVDRRNVEKRRASDKDITNRQQNLKEKISDRYLDNCIADLTNYINEKDQQYSNRE